MYTGPNILPPLSEFVVRDTTPRIPWLEFAHSINLEYEVNDYYIRIDKKHKPKLDIDMSKGAEGYTIVWV